MLNCVVRLGLGVAVAGGLTVSAGAASVSVDFDFVYDQASIDRAEGLGFTLPGVSGNLVYDSDFVSDTGSTALVFGDGLELFALDVDGRFSLRLEDSTDPAELGVNLVQGPSADFVDGTFVGATALATVTAQAVPISVSLGRDTFDVSIFLASGGGTVTYADPVVLGDDGMGPDIGDGGDDGGGMDMGGDDGGVIPDDGGVVPDDGGPNVIPSPTAAAAAAGLMLLGLAGARRRRGA